MAELRITQVAAYVEGRGGTALWLTEVAAYVEQRRPPELYVTAIAAYVEFAEAELAPLEPLGAAESVRVVPRGGTRSRTEAARAAISEAARQGRAQSATSPSASSSASVSASGAQTATSTTSPTAATTPTAAASLTGTSPATPTETSSVASSTSTPSGTPSSAPTPSASTVSPSSPMAVSPAMAARLSAAQTAERMVRQAVTGRAPTSSTAADPVHWRAYVGPPFLADSNAAFWDWSALSLAAYDPVPVVTDAPAGLAAAATSITLEAGDGATWPSAGGFWVGPISAGESWEYVRYTGKSTDTLTGLVRETVDDEQTGNHAAGAFVRFWWPLDTATGALTITEQTNDGMNVVGWNAQIGGVKFPQAAIRNGHLCLIQWRWTDAEGEWGDWENAFIGWINSPQVKDSGDREGEWSATVVGLDGMLDTLDAPGVRVGKIDAARNGQVSTSSTIGAAYMEAGHGEFVAAEPSLSGESAIDGNLATLWMSSGYIGSENQYASIVPIPGNLAQAHIAPYVGQSSGFRWVWAQHLLKDTWRITNQAGQFWQIEDSEGSVIFVESGSAFSVEWSNVGDARIVDTSALTLYDYYLDDDENLAVRESATTNTEWWDSLAPAGGGIRLVKGRRNYESEGACLLWGTVSPTSIPWGWGNWDGAYMPSPAPGETIRAVYAPASPTESHDYWTVDNVATPGYNLDDADYEWILVKLEPIGLALTGDITDSVPTTAGTLPISNAAGPSVDGVAASGTLQVGSEQITYSAKTSAGDGVVVTARGANGTTAAAHNEGDLVYFVEGSTATDALPVASITIERPTGVPVVEDYKIYGSKSAYVRTPEDGSAFWLEDYDLIATIADNAAASDVTTLGTPTRYRHILVVITAMGTKPYRCAINTLEVAIDATVYASGTSIASGDVADAVLAILDRCGIPSGAITDAGDTPTVDDYTTENAQAWQVLADMAEYTGVRITIARDSKISIAIDPYWSIAGVPAEAGNWTRLTASNVSPVWTNGRSVGQVELEWVAQDGSTRGVVEYPAARDAFGSVVRLGPLCYADEAAALVGAQKRYWQARRPYSLVVQSATVYPTMRAGQIHGLDWKVDQTMREMDRAYMVLAHAITVENGGAEQTLQMAQVSREDER